MTVSVGPHHTVGLKSDGTVIVVNVMFPIGLKLLMFQQEDIQL